MGLTSDLLHRRRVSAQTPSEFKTRLLESNLTVSLREILSEYLLEHDRLMVEVDPSVLGVFTTVLSLPEFQTYRCVQLEDNKFVFTVNEFLFL